MGDLASGQLDLLGGFSDPDPGPAGPTSLLIIDTETTGLDPELDQCLELGVILFSVPSRAVLAQQSFLLPVESNAAEVINRIPAAVTRLPQPWKEAMRYFQSLLEAADLLWLTTPPLIDSGSARVFFPRCPIRGSAPWRMCAGLPSVSSVHVRRCGISHSLTAFRCGRLTGP